MFKRKSLKSPIGIQSSLPPLPNISMDTFQRLKDRLLEQYQKNPKFHAIVQRFHASMQDGSITSEALFDALFLAKEIFIREKESRILADLEWEHQHGKEKPCP